MFDIPRTAFDPRTVAQQDLVGQVFAYTWHWFRSITVLSVSQFDFLLSLTKKLINQERVEVANLPRTLQVSAVHYQRFRDDPFRHHLRRFEGTATAEAVEEAFKSTVCRLDARFSNGEGGFSERRDSYVSLHQSHIREVIEAELRKQLQSCHFTETVSIYAFFEALKYQIEGKRIPKWNTAVDSVVESLKVQYDILNEVSNHSISLLEEDLGAQFCALLRGLFPSGVIERKNLDVALGELQSLEQKCCVVLKIPEMIDVQISHHNHDMAIYLLKMRGVEIETDFSLSAKKERLKRELTQISKKLSLVLECIGTVSRLLRREQFKLQTQERSVGGFPAYVQERIGVYINALANSQGRFNEHLRNDLLEKLKMISVCYGDGDFPEEVINSARKIVDSMFSQYDPCRPLIDELDREIAPEALIYYHLDLLRGFLIYLTDRADQSLQVDRGELTEFAGELLQCVDESLVRIEHFSGDHDAEEKSDLLTKFRDLFCEKKDQFSLLMSQLLKQKNVLRLPVGDSFVLKLRANLIALRSQLRKVDDSSSSIAVIHINSIISCDLADGQYERLYHAAAKTLDYFEIHQVNLSKHVINTELYKRCLDDLKRLLVTLQTRTGKMPAPQFCALKLHISQVSSIDVSDPFYLNSLYEIYLDVLNSIQSEYTVNGQKKVEEGLDLVMQAAQEACDEWLTNAPCLRTDKAAWIRELREATKEFSTLEGVRKEALVRLNLTLLHDKICILAKSRGLPVCLVQEKVLYLLLMKVNSSKFKGVSHEKIQKDLNEAIKESLNLFYPKSESELNLLLRIARALLNQEDLPNGRDIPLYFRSHLNMIFNEDGTWNFNSTYQSSYLTHFNSHPRFKDWVEVALRNYTREIEAMSSQEKKLRLQTNSELFDDKIYVASDQHPTVSDWLDDEELSFEACAPARVQYFLCLSRFDLDDEACTSFFISPKWLFLLCCFCPSKISRMILEGLDFQVLTQLNIQDVYALSENVTEWNRLQSLVGPLYHLRSGDETVDFQERLFEESGESYQLTDLMWFLLQNVQSVERLKRLGFDILQLLQLDVSRLRIVIRNAALVLKLIRHGAEVLDLTSEELVETLQNSEQILRLDQKVCPITELFRYPTETRRICYRNPESFEVLVKTPGCTLASLLSLPGSTLRLHLKYAQRFHEFAALIPATVLQVMPCALMSELYKMGSKDGLLLLMEGLCIRDFDGISDDKLKHFVTLPGEVNMTMKFLGPRFFRHLSLEALIRFLKKSKTILPLLEKVTLYYHERMVQVIQLSHLDEDTLENLFSCKEALQEALRLGLSATEIVDFNENTSVTRGAGSSNLILERISDVGILVNLGFKVRHFRDLFLKRRLTTLLEKTPQVQLWLKPFSHLDADKVTRITSSSPLLDLFEAHGEVIFDLLRGNPAENRPKIPFNELAKLLEDQNAGMSYGLTEGREAMNLLLELNTPLTVAADLLARVRIRRFIEDHAEGVRQLSRAGLVPSFFPLYSDCELKDLCSQLELASQFAKNHNALSKRPECIAQIFCFAKGYQQLSSRGVRVRDLIPISTETRKYVLRYPESLDAKLLNCNFLSSIFYLALMALRGVARSLIQVLG